MAKHNGNTLRMGLSPADVKARLGARPVQVQSSPVQKSKFELAADRVAARNNAQFSVLLLNRIATAMLVELRYTVAVVSQQADGTAKIEAALLRAAVKQSVLEARKVAQVQKANQLALARQRQAEQVLRMAEAIRAERRAVVASAIIEAVDSFNNPLMARGISLMSLVNKSVKKLSYAILGLAA
jgi:hypothetical protein